jgi:hypothetical protein
MRVILSSIVFGVTSRRCASNSSAILSGVWFGTRRMLTFAIATAGSTVFAPSPVKPDSKPLTSNVGRAHVRSSVEYPVSPNTFRMPKSFYAASRCRAAGPRLPLLLLQRHHIVVSPGS